MLNDKLIAEIRAGGPLRVDEFMVRALFDAEEGYYTTRHVFGRKGDFITAPEISQIFGEMIAIFIAAGLSEWSREQELQPVQLVEIGPGRGTLMHDMLRTMQYMPEASRPSRVVMVEASERLRDQQYHLLKPFMPESSEDFIEWHDGLDSLMPSPSVIVANEFFDALPVRQFIRREAGWHERLVTEDAGVLIWDERPVDDLPFLHESLDQIKPGGMVEYSAEASEVMRLISRRLATHDGMAIIIDYGPATHIYGESLQAVRKHGYAHPLEAVGEADITAHVHFATLKDIAQEHGLVVQALTTQHDFLEALGAELRLSRLCQNAEPAQMIDLIRGLDRLMSPVQMGELFKVLVVASPRWPVIQAFKTI